MATSMGGPHYYEDIVPSSEWIREEGADTLTVELPGFRKDQIRVQLDNYGNLRTSGERPLDATSNRWHRFRKEFRIPDNCNAPEIHAKFENGILMITLPKLTTTITTATQPQPQPLQPQPQPHPPQPQSQSQSQPEHVSPPPATQSENPEHQPENTDPKKTQTAEASQKVDEFVKEVKNQCKRRQLMMLIVLFIAVVLFRIWTYAVCNLQDVRNAGSERLLNFDEL